MKESGENIETHTVVEAIQFYVERRNPFTPLTAHARKTTEPNRLQTLFLGPGRMSKA